MEFTTLSSLEKNNCHYSVEMEKTIDELYTAAESGSDAALSELPVENHLQPLLFRPIPPGGYTALHIAAYCGRKTFVEKLLALYPYKASVDLEGRHNFLKVRDAYKNNTALHEVVRGGDHHDIVQLLVSADPTLVDDRNNDGESPLFIAAENGHLNAVKALLPRTHPPYERSDGRTPLHQAMYGQHYEVVKTLSQNHELVKAEDIEGKTVLHVAALIYECQEEIVKQLLEPDISLSYKQDKINRQTALHIAASEGNVGFVRCILKIARRSTEIVDKDGRHALHLAVKNDHVNIVKELLKSMPRKSVEMVDKDGRHALHLAAEKGNGSIVKELLESMPRLINVPDRNGCTALDIAIAEERDAVVAEFVTGTLRRCNGKRGVRKVRERQDRGLQQREQEDRELQQREQRQFGQINTLSVMAVLIATVSFQAAIQPPGGPNQENGLPVLADNSVFKRFMGFNDGAYYLSTSAAAVMISSVIVLPFVARNIGIGLNMGIVLSYYLVWMALWLMVISFTTARYFI